MPNRDLRPEAFWNHALDTVENGLNLLDQLADSGTEQPEQLTDRLRDLAGRMVRRADGPPQPDQ